jgi:stress response protein SCP2
MAVMTHVMAKGSNIPLEAAGIRAVLRWNPGPDAPDVDASVLLLGPDGRVRSDADFVFYNAPRHPSGLARHLPKKRVLQGLTDTVEVDLAALEPGVDRVVVAASCDGGPFRQVQDLVLALYDTAGAQHAAPMATFDVVPETGQETALICGELYRRGAGWKFRALGQGYTSGLVGLATEFGIAVDDGEVVSGSAAAAATEAAAPTEAYGYPLPAPYPSHVPAQPAYGYPQPVAAPTQPPAPPQQPPAAYPSYGYPQPVSSAAPDGRFKLPPQGPQFQGA